MNYQYTIGIVGLGFVGNAIRSSLEFGMVETLCYDIDPAKSNCQFEDLLKAEGIFVCVPSPSRADGSCDAGILESILESLKDYKGVIISKTTAPPGKYEELSKRYDNLVHSPEFLTAANAAQDYASATWCIIGGKIKAYRQEAERLIKLTQPNLKVIKHSGIGDASLAKYAINTFLATKVVFMNELHQLANKAGLNYDIVANLIKQDARIGDSHIRVPGPDGSFGFGGACFPKDTAALLKYAEDIGINLNILNTAVKKNLLLRLTESK